MQITRIAIQRPVTISMVVIAVAVFGFISLDRLPLNLLPDISYPSLTIQTEYTDAAPEEIETLVTRPVEESIGVVSGLNRVTSASRPGQSEVILEFNWNTDMDMAGVEVREKLDRIEFPQDVEKPVILRFDPSSDPILRIQVHGGATLARLRDITEREFKKRLESIKGVAAVKVAGGRDEQIRIEIDEKRVAELGIPITRVTDILRQENLNRASGSLYDLEMNYMVRMVNEFRTIDEIRRIVIYDRAGRQILLKDIANVWRGSRERDIIARYNGEESVEMAVYKEGDANTVTVSGAVNNLLENMRKEATFPQGVETSVVFNQADFISSSVKNVLQAAILGGLLSTFILFVFLQDGRSTLIIALSIPISILATFSAMYQTGITLNIMSLGGVALGVGMLVDNSIVVLESIHRYRKPGAPLAAAVLHGTNEVAMPVVASTLTTVAVFLPLIFVEGIAGQLFKDQALTITYSLLASLAVALTFIPMLLSTRMKSEEALAADISGEPEQQPRSRLMQWSYRAARFVLVDTTRIVITDLRRLLQGVVWILNHIRLPALWNFEKGFERLSRQYLSTLETALDHKLEVFGIVLGSVLLAAVTGMFLGAELIPPLNQGEFSFELTLPQGRPIESTDNIMRQVENKAKEVQGVSTVFSSIGGNQENQFASGTLEENMATLFVIMEDRSDNVTEEAAIQQIRSEIDHFPEALPTFSRPTLFSFKTPVEVEIYAQEIADQRSAANLIASRLSRIDGLHDIETTTRLGNPEIQIRFDRFRLNRLGLQENTVAALLRNKIQGDVASRYREGDRQIDILVRVDEADRNATTDIENMIINSSPRNSSQGNSQSSGSNSTNTLSSADPVQQNQENQTDNNRTATASRPFVPIRLGQVASVDVSRGPSEIRRIRSQRAAVVTANLSGRSLSSVSRDIQSTLTELGPQLPLNSTAVLGGQNEELNVSYRSLAFAMALAIFLVYLVMASQFESLIHPFIILFTVPLALVGVVFALGLTGTTLSVVVLLGVIILAGIVVNNAIVLVDYTNRLRVEGMTKRNAILQAGQIRLRPILMTSLTTLLGLAPMAFGWGEGDEVRAPMAIAVIGGMLLTTPMTLILIPVVYELLDRKSFAPDNATSNALEDPSNPLIEEPI